MKKALILYMHGLGDIILLTPCLRNLYRQGYIVDLVAKQRTIDSHLLDDCPYVDKIIGINESIPFDRGYMEIYESMCPEYDLTDKVTYAPFNRKSKIEQCEWELGLDLKDDYGLEVFISQSAQDTAQEYIERFYPDGYIFNHTMIEIHPPHSWDSTQWIKDNLPRLPICDTGYNGKQFMLFEDINAVFVLAREANHRVLSSSVMVHACDAMGSTMDIINYHTDTTEHQGRTSKVWPLDQTKVFQIREFGKYLK